jgi:hypothetical protein
MPSPYGNSKTIRTVLPGFPKLFKFRTPEELKDYFGGEKIQCLRCGKFYRTLGVHLAIHEMKPDEYREEYGIPWTYGLSCTETKKLKAEHAKKMITLGLFVPGAYLEQAYAKEHKKRQPVRDVLSQRNIEMMNIGKTGEKAAAIRATRVKRGTPEFKAKMRNRPQAAKTMKILTEYWKGRTQSDEHVFKRTGHHKKRQSEPTSF